ncbi:MAG: hypothetical protein PHO01_11065 [Desulfotomaculaceae bacterium]|nr:hypothetical protein [Desulfotomaculaceae bacterium]
MGFFKKLFSSDTNNVNKNEEELISIPFADNPPLFDNKPPMIGSKHEIISGNPNKSGSYHSNTSHYLRSGDGLASKDIAHKMGITYKTTDNPNIKLVKHVLEKTNCPTSGKITGYKGGYNNGGKGYIIIMNLIYLTKK